tara:strand:+ start:4380 stop:5186 length:807 start_codon:yes stop_codon:yes gene_type:complete
MITESESLYENLEGMNTNSLLININNEDHKVSNAVKKEIYKIELLVDAVFKKMVKGGRLFYIGAGTSGRLGILDASECPPTFGVGHGVVYGIIAGGDQAIRQAVENAEDDQNQAWVDLETHKVNKLDSIIGITASGKTPYVLGGLKAAKRFGCLTACLVCNGGSLLSKLVDHPIEIIVGPEFLTGSTRMKSGTAQKLVLNMISTTLMIKLGHVEGNMMIDMQLTNDKLIKRGIKMLYKLEGINELDSLELLKKSGSVRNAIIEWKRKK